MKYVGKDFLVEASLENNIMEVCSDKSIKLIKRYHIENQPYKNLEGQVPHSWEATLSRITDLKNSQGEIIFDLRSLHQVEDNLMIDDLPTSAGIIDFFFALEVISSLPKDKIKTISFNCKDSFEVEQFQQIALNFLNSTAHTTYDDLEINFLSSDYCNAQAA